MTNHGAILRLIRNIEEDQPVGLRLALRELETLAAHWGGRWYVYRVEINGREYWPVLNEAKHNLIKGHAGWDLVTSCWGRGFDE